MVIGGYNNGGGLNDVEEVKLNASLENECPVPNTFHPKYVYDAVGANMNGTPIVCGGWYDGVGNTKMCWTYDLDSQNWTNSGNMSTARRDAGGAYDPLIGFVISGGRGGTYDAVHTSVERTYDGVNFSTLPDMPRAFHYGIHCLVSLKNGVLFATGVHLTATHERQQGTYMYHGSNNSWSAMNNFPEEGNVLDGCSCGTIEEDGQVTEVIAAGGLHSNGVESKSVFIYNIESGLWRSGQNLPFKIKDAASVPYQGSFLLLGGWCYDCTDRSLDTVIKYNKDTGEWETLPARLAVGRYDHVAITKPAC